MSNQSTVTRYFVFPDADVWRVRCRDEAVGEFPTRAGAFAAAVTFAEGVVGDGRRAEVICQAAPAALAD